MAKVSVAQQVRQAKQEEAHRAKEQAKMLKTASGSFLKGATADSFVNFAHKLGVGADNPLTAGTYGYNPITRQRTLLEWIHRGSWLGGVAIDVVADDMTRAGINFTAEMEPEDQEEIESEAETLGIWDRFNECIKWGRLYGGCLIVLLVDGQDPRTPLRLETVGPDQFKGLAVLDRWMVDPSLNDLVTDYGPHLGLPKYYTVQANAPALRGAVIHHSRLAARLTGIELPYQQRLTENLWGISVLERLYDRMIAFDSASTGAAQLVFKAHLRTLAVEGMRDIVASGGPAMNGLYAYTEVMRRFQGIEGITLIDKADEFEVQGSGSAFSGVSQIIEGLADQISGALQVPKTRLFGQSPGGLGSNGKGEERQYYDSIRQKQRRELRDGVLTTYKLMAQSKGVKIPDNFGIDFASLVELDDSERSEVAGKITDAVTKAQDGGLVSQKVAMQELRQSSRATGIFTNITSADIEAADDEITPPVGELEMATALAEVKQGASPAGGGPSKGTGKKLPGDAGKTKRTPLKE